MAVTYVENGIAEDRPAIPNEMAVESDGNMSEELEETKHVKKSVMQSHFNMVFH